MTWHETCDDFDSRVEASAKDFNFNDTVFLLTQTDADDDGGDKVFANKAILALISPVFYAQFYGPLAPKNDGPIEIVDGTAKGFKQLINFICNPKSYEIKLKNVAQVFDISYFAHKYQISKLESLCREFFAMFHDMGNEVKVLNWAVSSERGLELKETFPVDHALLVHSCWECLTIDLKRRFPNGALKDGQDLPDEDLMIEILGWQPGRVEEEFLLSVALDYYSKLMNMGQKVVKEQKRLKVDSESEWDVKIDKIKSVVQLDKIPPKKVAAIYEMFHKIPDVVGKVVKEISISWKDKDTFDDSFDNDPDLSDNLFEIPFSLIDSDNTDDFIHNDTSPREVKIKFKTNQNAILHLEETKFITCPCSDIECCMDGSVTFQNEDYKDQGTSAGESYFYVKGNKEATLTYRRECALERDSCDSHLVRMNQFHLSKGDFEVNILEVDGQPITSPCFTFIEHLLFTPI